MLLEIANMSFHVCFVCLYHESDQCSFVEKPSQSVRNHLQSHLKAQDRAVESIIAAIEAWEFS